VSPVVSELSGVRADVGGVGGQMLPSSVCPSQSLSNLSQTSALGVFSPAHFVHWPLRQTWEPSRQMPLLRVAAAPL